MAKKQKKNKEKNAQPPPKVPLSRVQVMIRAALSGVAFFIIAKVSAKVAPRADEEAEQRAERLAEQAAQQAGALEEAGHSELAAYLLPFAFGVAFYFLLRIAASMATDIASAHPLFSLSTRKWRG